MRNADTLANKAACIAAYLRGEKIEYMAGDALESKWVPLDMSKDEFTEPGWRYRIAPKPEPKLPTHAFWVRLHGCIRAYWVTAIDVGRVEICGKWVDNGDLFANHEWSHDRKTWYTFTGEVVK